jgi:hypothetical protein
LWWLGVAQIGLAQTLDGVRFVLLALTCSFDPYLLASILVIDFDHFLTLKRSLEVPFVKFRPRYLIQSSDLQAEFLSSVIDRNDLFVEFTQFFQNCVGTFCVAHSNPPKLCDWFGLLNHRSVVDHRPAFADPNSAR